MASNELSPYAALWGTDLINIWNLMRQRCPRKWGFVVYRCTYDDDKGWERFMEILNERTMEALQADEAWPGYGKSILDCLDWSVQYNRATLDHATIDQVRNRSRTWLVSDMAQAEEGPLGPVDRETVVPEPFFKRPPRNRYCIHVDAVSLDSVVRQAPHPREPDLRGGSYVNLVDAVVPFSLRPFLDRNRNVVYHPDEKHHYVG